MSCWAGAAPQLGLPPRMRRGSLSWRALVAAAVAVSWLVFSPGCNRSAARDPVPSLPQLRKTAASSDDAEIVGRWLLAELISPGGDARRARDARKQLESAKNPGVLAPLARGIDDWVHGRLKSAPEHFMQAAKVARVSEDPNAELLAWF